MDVWFATHTWWCKAFECNSADHFSVIVHSFNWRNASCGPLAIGFYLLAQDGTTGLDVVLHLSCIYWGRLLMLYDPLTMDVWFATYTSWCKAFECCNLMHIFASLCTVFNWHGASRGPSAIAELLFIFSYKIDWFGCGFFMLSCIC